MTPQEILEKASKSWEEANKFHHSGGGVNPTPYVMGYKAAIADLEKADKNDTIPFAVFLTGHSQDTIEQMYNDFKKTNNENILGL